MKISSFNLHSIAIADGPLRSSYGRHAPYALRTIVELRTDDGFTGWSETYGGERPLAALEAVRPQIEGMNPFRLAELLTALNKEVAPLGDEVVHGGRSQTYLVPGENPLDEGLRTFAAIEIACLDIIGKATGQPVCDVIGGRVRDAVPFSAYLFYKDAGGGGLGPDTREDEYGEVLSAAACAREARQMIAQYGFREIKLKGGVLPADVEIETIQALRREFGAEYPLRIDPNCAWSVETSVRVGKTLRSELSNGGYLEDPCASLAGMAEVRRRLLEDEVLLASNVAVTNFADVVEARDREAVQIVLSDPHYWGGLRQMQHLSQVCGMLGRGMSMHSNNHLGVSLMAMTHAAAACANLTYACDTHYPWQSAQDEIVEGGRIQFDAGSVRIPDKPGLGIEIDRDQLERGKERHARLPYRKRDDAAEMRLHVDPKWERVLPRW